MYDRNVSNNHLDIGVGTGYFLDHCRFPSANPRLALMDVNHSPLEFAARRLARYRPETYLADATKPFGIEAPVFDSVALTNLLHCLPGDMAAKCVVLDNVQDFLNPGGVVFGATLMYRGVRCSPYATAAMRINNWLGTMCNLKDTIEDLEQALRSRFRESMVIMVGCEAVFWARSR